ncbi:hypothetical protein EJ08DRAFT_164387 [Tothia fuscella]|uniref:Zinc knuckle-domain-containing protein n=1 Tax=Tothia fuscella TaxID=1048955 RepID=A0A9P4NU78_9PEZI|nr:hypothetical protein EJ08DRAFT_164387 [Tothia fuscella]
MNRPFYRPPAQSRASPTTLCQKCLKKGHFSYECKAPAAERPYAARPSRTQQLMNPKLAPQLTNDLPDDLQRREGVADEILAAKKAERGRKRSIDDHSAGPRKASRSVSSSSFDSVSTISTAASRSPSPRRGARHNSPPDQLMTSQYEEGPPPVRDVDHARKRRRRSVSSSHHSRASRGDSNRNTRRRRRSISPAERGRRRSREKESRSRSRTRSRSVPRKNGQSGIKSSGYGRGGRRISPSRSPYRQGHGRQNGNNGPGQPSRPAPPRGPPKERSLSPFSKRLALTQAMNMGR